MFGEDVWLCTACAPWFGPPDDCSAVWTPDPLDGVFKVCSGHGAYTAEGCSCFGNSTGGYWALASVQGVETCAACAEGFNGTGCLG